MDRRRFLGFLAIVPFASNAAISGVSSQVLAGDKEASTLIVGFGSCGQNLVKEMILECRASPDLWPRPIQFHVADEPSVLPENIPSHPLISNDSRHRHDSERTIVLPGSLIEQATSADKLIMVAGLGGFIGSYAAVAIAQAFSGLKTDIHACVTMPFRFEGARHVRLPAL